MALSTSPHWRSSMARTRAVRFASRVSSSRSPAKARRRSSCWSGISGGVAPRRGDRLDALQDREDPGQERHVLGQAAPGPRAAAAPSDAAPGHRSSYPGPCTGPILARNTARRGRRPRPGRSARRGTTGSAWSCRSPSGRRRRSTPSGPGSGRRTLHRGRGGVATVRSGGAARFGSGTSTASGTWPLRTRDDLATTRPTRRVPVQQHHAQPDQVLRQSRPRARPAMGAAVSAWRRSAPGASRRTGAGRSGPRRA